eukprot:869834_1
MNNARSVWLTTRHFSQIPINSLKICTKCKSKKITDEFHRNRCKKDGLSTYCAECSRQVACQYTNTLKGWMSKLCRISKYHQKKGGGFNLNVQFLVDLWESQGERLNTDKGYEINNAA